MYFNKHSLFLTQDLKPHCQRGCQYFNIVFLISASNKHKVDDISSLTTKCKTCKHFFPKTLIDLNLPHIYNT